MVVVVVVVGVVEVVGVVGVVGVVVLTRSSLYWLASRLTSQGDLAQFDCAASPEGQPAPAAAILEGQPAPAAASPKGQPPICRVVQRPAPKASLQSAVSCSGQPQGPASNLPCRAAASPKGQPPICRVVQRPAPRASLQSAVSCRLTVVVLVVIDAHARRLGEADERAKNMEVLCDLRVVVVVAHARLGIDVVDSSCMPVFVLIDMNNVGVPRGGRDGSDRTRERVVRTVEYGVLAVFHDHAEKKYGELEHQQHDEISVV